MKYIHFAYIRLIIPLILYLASGTFCYAQISPGELSEFHSRLEGMSKCTQCHTLGQKVSNDKCLDCHTELKSRVTAQKGYHASVDVKGKACPVCHNEHHGKTFKLVKFDTEKFNHALTGYKLEGAHSKKTCKDCHKPEKITSPELKKKKFTYLGLNTQCLSCHADYHQKTLSSNCQNCHTQAAFKPASLFNHDKAKFQLKGKHEQVPCLKCHQSEIRDGKKFQAFTGIKYDQCVNCHKDPHENKFGQNCKQCHSESSFKTIRDAKGFDHSKTSYPLIGKHQQVDCKKCHTGKMTDPLPHGQCVNCHKDYHNGQFLDTGKPRDCQLCHDNQGFTPSSFTIEKHNALKFQLQGAHLATPCFSCHKKTEKWSFREIGQECNDCHPNIHEPQVEKKDYRYSLCKTCHATETWARVSYDHSRTNFPLSGAHARQSCRNCHFSQSAEGKVVHRFAGLPATCTQCHNDIHFNQFQVNGVSQCNKCHSFDNWKIGNFNHDQAAFKLDGRHKNVACIKCHPVAGSGDSKYILYKTNKTKCENCH